MQPTERTKQQSYDLIKKYKKKKIVGESFMTLRPKIKSDYVCPG